MATIVTVNNNSYAVPDFNERGWSEDVSGLLVELANAALHIDGSNQSSNPLTSDADFGTNNGLLAKFISARNAAETVSTSGSFRLAKTGSLAWRNHANTVDKKLELLAADILAFDGEAVVLVNAAQTLTNKTIDADTNTILDLETDNLKAGVLNVSPTLAGATDLQIPSAKAVRDAIDATASGGATKADKATILTAGAGLSGGGDLSANRTFDINVDNSTIEINTDTLRIKDSGVTDSKVASGIDAAKIADGSVSNTEFGHLRNVTSDIQTQITDKVVKNADIVAATKTKITYDTKGLVTAGADLVAADMPANIDAAKIADGSVSNDEFQRIGTLTSNAQDQLDARVMGPASSVNNRLATFDGTTGKLVKESTVTADSSGNLVVPGNLTVSGTTTSINSTNLDVADKQITVNKGGVSPSAEGSGIAVESDAAIVSTVAYDSTKASKWTANNVELVNVSSAQTLSGKVHEFVRTESQALTISSSTITPTKGLARITGGGTSLNTVTGNNVDGAVQVVYNDSGSDITVTNAGNMVTGTGADMILKNTAAVSLVYSSATSKWLVTGGAGGGGLTLSVNSSAFTAVAGTHYLCSTSGAAFTATMPTGANGFVIRFSDDSRTWGTNNLTITPATGQRIGSLAVNESLICDLTGAWVQLNWDGSKWVIDTNGYAAAVSSGSLSSGSGSGEKNYIGNPNNATNWSVSGAGVTVVTESGVNNLPNNVTQTSGIRITRVSGTTDYARFRFTLDTADYNKKFKVSFDQKYAGTAGDYTLAVFSNTASDYTGTSTQLQLQTSSVSALTGSFVTSVDMPGSTAPYIEFRVVAVAGTTPLYLNNVYVGPGTITPGAAVSEWVSYVPTGSWSTNTTYTGQWRRVGSNMELRFSVEASGAPTAAVLTVNIPSGFTIDTSKLRLPTGSNDEILGVAHLLDAGASHMRLGQVVYNNTSSVRFLAGNAAGTDGNPDNNFPFTWAANDKLWGSASLPIAEWAGNGTVNLGAGAQVEYAATSGTWNADSSTTVYGPGGQPMGGALAVGRLKTITWQYPIQAGDQIMVEGSRDGLTWAPLNGFAFSVGQVIPGLTSTATEAAGVSFYNPSSTQTIVVFNRYVQIANDDAPVTDWPSSNAYWRVRKSSASAPVGFSLAGTVTGAGFVAPRKGQYSLTVTSSVGGWVTTRVVAVYYQDQDGNHRLKFNLIGTNTSGSRTGCTLTLSGVVFKNTVGYTQCVSFMTDTAAIPLQAYTNVGASTIGIVHSSATTTYYAVSGDVELDSKPTWA
jgi:hypothetical protein